MAFYDVSLCHFRRATPLATTSIQIRDILWNNCDPVLFGTVSYEAIPDLKHTGSLPRKMRSLVYADKITVMVVEDEVLIRLDIVDQLESAGFQVFEAGSADSAIDSLERHPEIRLIFTDIDMPGTMDGLKLAMFVRDRWPPIKIIVTSGRVLPDQITLPHDVPFLPKPYAFENVVTVIRTLMI